MHPSRPQLVLTASKDESVRLWSLAGRCCVAVFKGEGAHAHEVLSLVRDLGGWGGWVGVVIWGAEWGGTRERAHEAQPGVWCAGQETPKPLDPVGFGGARARRGGPDGEGV